MATELPGCAVCGSTLEGDDFAIVWGAAVIIPNMGANQYSKDPETDTVPAMHVECVCNWLEAMAAELRAAEGGASW